MAKRAKRREKSMSPTKLWSDFLIEIQGLGFEIVFTRPFRFEVAEETLIIAADPKRKLLLRADSFHTHKDEVVVSQGLVWGTIQVHQSDTQWFTGCMCSDQTVSAWSSRSDDRSKVEILLEARDPLAIYLENLGRKGKFVSWKNQWRQLDLRDTHELARSHQAYGYRLGEFMENAPQWVKDFIL